MYVQQSLYIVLQYPRLDLKRFRLKAYSDALFSENIDLSSQMDSSYV